MKNKTKEFFNNNFLQFEGQLLSLERKAIKNAYSFNEGEKNEDCFTSSTIIYSEEKVIDDGEVLRVF